MQVEPTNDERDPAPPEDRILDALVSEIAETGLVGLSIDRVASRAAVSKTTIYSRWRTKDDLIGAAFASFASGPIEFSLSEGLRPALREVFEYGKRLVTDPRMETLLAELFAASHSNDAARKLVVDLRANWYRATSTMLAQARDIGELPADADVEFLTELVAALMTYRALSPGFAEPFDDATLERIESLVLDTPPRLATPG